MLAKRIVRICLVDSPADYPFITDGFFNFINDHLLRLEFLYLRELDLENLNYATVKKMAHHPSLKKVIAHMCRKIDVLQEFGPLPQLLVVKGEIQGLKAFLGDAFPPMDDDDTEESSSDDTRPGGSGQSSAKAVAPPPLSNGASA